MQSLALTVDRHPIPLDRSRDHMTRDDTWRAALVIVLWLGAMAWGIGFIVRYI